MSAHTPTPRQHRVTAALALLTLVITSLWWSAAPPANATGPSRTISPTSINWQRVQRDAYSGMVPITVTNTSSVPLTISSVTLTGPDTDAFWLDEYECMLAPVAPGQYCRIFIQVAAPHEIGFFSAAIVVVDDATPAGQQIPLTAATWYVGGGSSGEYFPVQPTRVVDSRKNLWFWGPIFSGPTHSLTLTTGIPFQGVSAVALNVTAVNSTATSFLTLWPGNEPRPVVSSLNTVPGRAVANFVIVQTNGSNTIDLSLGAGSTDLIIDVVGYFGNGWNFGGSGARFHPVDPFRMMDSRDGTGPMPQRPLAPGETVAYDVRGAGGQIPANGIAAVALNVTAVHPTAPRGYLTVYPGDIGRPTTSNVNFTKGTTVPNVVIVEVPPDGVVDFFNSDGSTEVVVDVIGYFDYVKDGDVGRYASITGIRAVDTRDSGPALGAAATRAVQLVGVGEIPAIAGVAVTNLTIIRPTTNGFATAFSDDLCTRPAVSNVNFVTGRTVANAVWSNIGTGTGCSAASGRVAVFNSAGTSHVALDVFGFFIT